MIILGLTQSLTCFFSAGYFFICHDISTSGQSGSNYVLPTIRVGHLRVRCLFSKPLPIDLTMLILAEFPSTLFISRTGKISSSYTQMRYVSKIYFTKFQRKFTRGQKEIAYVFGKRKVFFFTPIPCNYTSSPLDGMSRNYFSFRWICKSK